MARQGYGGAACRQTSAWRGQSIRVSRVSVLWGYPGTEIVRWYSVEAESGPSRASGHSAKRFRPSGNEGTAFHDATDKHNPYGHATSHIVSEGQAVSPRYAPPSPAGSVPERYASPTHAPIEPNIHQDAVRHDNQPAPPPPIGVHPTHTVSATDALGYAMASQYWAGYWMGIAQAQTGTSSPGAVAITSTDPSTNDSSALGGIASPANVRTTRRDHARQVNGGLRR